MDKSIVPVNQVAVHSSSSYEFSNKNEAEIVELEDDSVEVVERKMEGLELDHQFQEENVPQFFRTFINDQIDNLLEIELNFHNSYCMTKFSLADDQVFNVRFEKRLYDWIICYNNSEETVKSEDPEKSIIDHLWFVLKHPNLDLNSLSINNECALKRKIAMLKIKKFEPLLQLMLESIDHQIHTVGIWMTGFNEDTFFSFLQRIKPGTLAAIGFSISWKENRNYEKMEEIAKIDQWKKALSITSCDITPLKIDDVMHCDHFTMVFEKITPEDVLLLREHAINNTKTREYNLISKDSINLNEIEKVLPSNCQREEIIDGELGHQIVYSYKIPNSRNSLNVELFENQITFVKNASSF